MAHDGKLDVSKRVFIMLVVFLVGLIGFWAFRMYEIYRNANGNYAREISVDAEGKAYVLPDVAEITLGVNTEAKTSDGAIAENTKKMNAVMTELAKFNIDKKDIQTTGYYLNPKYNWTEDKGSVQDGYTLDQTVLVKVRDFTKVGEILAATTKAGANVVSGVNFTNDDLEKAKSEARAIAIEKAKEKAKAIAEQSGLKVGKMVGYYEYMTSPYDYYGKGGMYMAEGGGMSESAAPVIEPGQKEVALTVTLTYKLK